MDEPTYIRQIHVYNNFVDRNFDIDLSPIGDEPFRHLILTGPNGSGKTTMLSALGRAAQTPEELKRRADAAANPQGQANFDSIVQHRGLTRIYWSDGKDGHLDTLRARMLPARRGHRNFSLVKGPTKDVDLTSPANIEQWLVNLRTQVALANEEQDSKAASELQKKIDRTQAVMRQLFSEPELALEFVREQLAYQLRFNGRSVTWNQLPDGYRSTLELWSTLRMASQRPPWVFLIDEVESHLHLELQESILPLLVEEFPNTQLIVATHSPAVIASIDGAVVYDLSSHEPVNSDELRGISYGTLMKEHFRLPTDVDLRTTKELAELRVLLFNKDRSDQEEARLDELAASLGARSPLLALLVTQEREKAAGV